MSYRYGWNTRSVGFLLAGVGVCSIIVQGVLVGPIVRQLGEQRTLLVGLAFAAVGFTIQALATSGVVYTIGVVTMSLWGLSGPALQGLMTKLVAPTEQGQLQGANSSIFGVSNLIGPILFTQIFAIAIATHGAWRVPGAPYLLSAFLVAIAFAVALRLFATQLRALKSVDAAA
jgi:MFS transporter, DHA1 family, tetracycline resistance protein